MCCRPTRAFKENLMRCSHCRQNLTDKSASGLIIGHCRRQTILFLLTNKVGKCEQCVTEAESTGYKGFVCAATQIALSSLPVITIGQKVRLENFPNIRRLYCWVEMHTLKRGIPLSTSDILLTSPTTYPQGNSSGFGKSTPSTTTRG